MNRVPMTAKGAEALQAELEELKKWCALELWQLLPKLVNMVT